jgi:hypothetical protein
MTTVSVLLLCNYQSNIDRSYSYEEINTSLLEEDVAKLLSIDPNTTILLCEILEQNVFTEKEQASINTMIAILDRMTPNYFFVVDSSLEHEISFGNKVVYLPGCMLLAYYPIWMDHHPNVTEWNPISNKGLLLLGKCEKVHRIGLLKKFYEKNALDSIEWSANFAHQYELIKEQFFTEYTDEEFKIFSDSCNRILDIPADHISYPLNPTTNFNYIGFPYDHTLYYKTAFSVITESQYYTVPEKRPWITEKTWRAIANKHPFIMIGSADNIPVLKNMGFRTFEEYLSIKDYNSLLAYTKNADISLDAIVTNTVNFCKSLNDPSSNIILEEPQGSTQFRRGNPRVGRKVDLKNKITEDVNHNYELFKSITREAIDTFLRTTKLDLTAIKVIVAGHL